MFYYGKRKATTVKPKTGDAIMSFLILLGIILFVFFRVILRNANTAVKWDAYIEQNKHFLNK